MRRATISSFRSHIVLVYLQPLRRNPPLNVHSSRKSQKNH